MAAWTEAGSTLIYRMYFPAAELVVMSDLSWLVQTLDGCLIEMSTEPAPCLRMAKRRARSAWWRWVMREDPKAPKLAPPIQQKQTHPQAIDFPEGARKL